MPGSALPTRMPREGTAFTAAKPILATTRRAAQYLAERAESAAHGQRVQRCAREPLFAGWQTNLYLLFMTGSWRRSAPTGVTALLHPDGHLTDPKAGPLARNGISLLQGSPPLDQRAADLLGDQATPSRTA